MSNLDVRPPVTLCGGSGDVLSAPAFDVLPPRVTTLGDASVRRLLPTMGRRMVGAWCFLDHYGPDDIATSDGMQVPPHPHTGLQTVSWLLEGEIFHRDSLGSAQLLRPGTLGLMTAGSAIAHSEQSPPVHPSGLHGTQLWVALPEGQRHRDPSWEFHAELPAWTSGGVAGTVLLGEVEGQRSPGVVHSPMVGVDLRVSGPGTVPVERDFEYAVAVVDGRVSVGGTAVPPGSLVYLGCGRRELALSGSGRALLLGGVPFAEKIVMWWNFVARSGEEVVESVRAWERGDFGPVPGYDGDPLPAPRLPATPLLPRGRRG
ncbi:pirin family protein [Actinokineospora guangxiensis]|uniref:Pirin family protein n=1 Tax=Actinokineospora guangxiensis TaxID=1490288 RepID=A0ABW0ETY1_9PSEU